MSTSTETLQALPTGTWQVDGTHSRVDFTVEYMTGTFRGSFTPFDARLEAGEEAVRLLGSTKVEHVTIQDENLKPHLLSPDFFDAERTPEVSFRSTKIRRSGDEIAISGELTIRGVSLPVELAGTVSGPITDPFGRERLNLELEGRIDRTAFGLNWNNPLPSGEPALANDVELGAELYLIKG